jgi:hypothetical protein
MKKQQKEYTSNILMLQSNVREKTTMINNLQRDMENLNEEKLNLAATLGKYEDDYVLCLHTHPHLYLRTFIIHKYRYN